MLNFGSAPADPIKRLMWLSGVMEQAKRELDEELQQAYFQARLEGRLQTAVALHYHSLKRILAFTRAENEKRGRVIQRWPDAREYRSKA